MNLWGTIKKEKKTKTEFIPKQPNELQMVCKTLWVIREKIWGMTFTSAKET